MTRLLCAIHALDVDQVDAWVANGEVNLSPERHYSRAPLGEAYAVWHAYHHVIGARGAGPNADAIRAHRILTALRDANPHEPLGAHAIHPKAAPDTFSFRPTDVFLRVCQELPQELHAWLRRGLLPGPKTAPLTQTIQSLWGVGNVQDVPAILDHLERAGHSLDAVEYGYAGTPRQYLLSNLLDEPERTARVAPLIRQWIARGDVFPASWATDCPKRLDYLAQNMPVHAPLQRTNVMNWMGTIQQVWDEWQARERAQTLQATLQSTLKPSPPASARSKMRL